MAELPALIDYDGDWDAYVEILYAIYKTDLLDRRCKLFGHDVTVKRHPECKGKHEGFWHVIQGSDDAAVPDFDRAARVPWIRALVESAGDDGICCWQSPRQDRQGRKRVLIATEDFSYVVVVELRIGPRSPYWLIITAYTPYASQARKLNAEYERQGQYVHEDPDQKQTGAAPKDGP